MLKLLWLLGMVAVAQGEDMAAGERQVVLEQDLQAGGTHWRIATKNGPIHVWRPDDIHQRGAGTVIFLHGYFTDVDNAWQEYRLAEQFAASNRNAIFIAPEAPNGDEQEPFWSSLKNLVACVFREIRVKPPNGPLVAAGHSGAFRTLVTWLENPFLREILLLDGLYRHEDKFARWLWTKGIRHRKMILVAVDTFERTEELVSKFPRTAVARVGLPEEASGFSLSERKARLLYLRAENVDHMGLITQGKVLPLALQLTTIEDLPLPTIDLATNVTPGSDPPPGTRSN